MLRAVGKWSALAHVAAVLACSSSVIARSTDQPMVPLTYPHSRRDATAETQFGERIADPYRWLENDIRSDADVADWADRQNAVTQAYLTQLPERRWFEERLRGIIDYERFGLPVKAGGRYFYTRNSGLLNQAQLFVRQGLRGKPRLLIDPNTWSGDGAVALDAWKPSDDGSLLLYSEQDSGSDWLTLRVLDVRTGKVLADRVEWAKYTTLAWVGDQGFVYSRFPEPEAGAAFQQVSYNHAVYFHRIGTPQSADELVYATPDQPETNHSARITKDGRHLLIFSTKGTDARHEVHVVNLARRGRGWTARTLVSGFDHDWKLVDGTGSTLWLITNWQAPRYRLMTVDLSARAPRWREVVAEGPDPLEQGTIIGSQLILSYLQDAATRAVIHDLDGKSVRTLALNGIGTVAGFKGRPGDPETFYSFTSFNKPQGIYRLNMATGRSTPFAEPDIGFEPHDYAVEQRFFASKDGTRVPLFVVRRKDVAAAGRAVPTLLYGYGGFDVSLTPSFSSIRMAWLEAGGAFALANLRGGGEYGREWHDGGRLANKQNSFDDFIAAGEYLIREGVTPKDGLAIQGGSNGGLLVGAVVNQRPDLFAAANAQVGVMDMLRFHKFTAGRYWIDDYGDPDKAADFKVLRAYSPYHNIRTGTVYPALLVTTADTDDRVVPGHSFKYAAALQAENLGPRPRLIRIETRAGHGGGKPTEKIIQEGADTLAFLAHWTGLAVK